MCIDPDLFYPLRARQLMMAMMIMKMAVKYLFLCSWWLILS